MARLLELETAAIGQSNLAGDIFYQLGLAYAYGRDVNPDRVAAHKWFNLAAARGNRDAVACRQEVAAEMDAAEIALAQRAAREWMTSH
jgi:TPR repeat protein